MKPPLWLYLLTTLPAYWSAFACARWLHDPDGLFYGYFSRWASKLTIVQKKSVALIVLACGMVWFAIAHLIRSHFGYW
jgi:hypothetical protein